MSLAAGANTAVAVAKTHTATTSGITTQASGSGFWLAVGWHSGATPVTPTDNKGNTYVQCGSTLNDGTYYWARYFCANGVGGSGHTFTFTTTGTASLIQILVQEVTTTNGKGVILGQSAQQELNAAPFVSPSVTTTIANEILIGGFLGHMASGTASFTANSGFTLGATILDGNTDNSSAVEYKVVSATGSYNSDFSISGVTWGANNQDITIDTFSEVPASLPASLRLNSSLNGLGSSGPHFHDRLA